jgi:hypothetical protein
MICDPVLRIFNLHTDSEAYLEGKKKSKQRFTEKLPNVVKTVKSFTQLHIEAKIQIAGTHLTATPNLSPNPKFNLKYHWFVEDSSCLLYI